MKIKSMMAVALAALCFTACSKSDDNVVPGDGPDLGPGEETYAMFSVSLVKANSTRAFHGSSSPTAEEGTVKNLTVYIYDYYTDAIEEVLTFTDENDTKTVLITTGPKKFVATSGMSPQFTQGQTVGVDINNTIMNIPDETYFQNNVTKDFEFWMTSDIVEHTVVSATKEEAESAGHHNNIAMKLGRAMGKIGVVYNESIVITDGVDPTPNPLGSMSGVEYRVKNQPDQMYLFTTEHSSGVWITPYYNRNNNLWLPSHAANYWYQQTWHSTAIDASQNHVEPTYMMENSNMTARYGNATYVSIKGVFSPTTWLDNAGNPVTGTPWNPGDDFWRIGYVDANGEVTGFVDNKIYSGEPIASLYASDGTEAPVKYENGEMYYWIYLDSSLGQAFPTNTADKYSQRRNHYWDVDITKVTGLGWNEEDGGRPEDPNPLDEQAYIHATIEILDWVEVYMPGELTGDN
ncbi:MAG: Mfa1 family fimbria major subunit [Bacteroides sp.]|nr:Mfa1 family fimbria major subunit [Bacteroides sp.]